MKSKEFLMLLLLALFVWSNRDRVPPEYQFWRNNQSWVKVQNSSDQDLTDVSVVVWGSPQKLGTIKKGQSRALKSYRKHDVTEVVIRFHYGNEQIERHVGTLDEFEKYQMLITVNYAGVVIAQGGSELPEAAATTQ
jgi:hypothetical protein